MPFYSYSNTSHVILYHGVLSCRYLLDCIQIHLMLFFIFLRSLCKIISTHSNTSHVILYPRHRTSCSSGIRIQIHLMLFFIRSKIVYKNPTSTFKYISCYSLSHTCLLVLTYVCEFKYISCYSLSWYHRVVPSLQNPFKYISCYSLSQRSRNHRSYNIFKYISCYSLSMPLSTALFHSRNSNTSHVILYPAIVCKTGSAPVFKYISCYSLSGCRSVTLAN